MKTILLIVILLLTKAQTFNRYAVYLNSAPESFDDDASSKKPNRPNIVNEVADWLSLRKIKIFEREDTPYFKVIVADLDRETLNLLKKADDKDEFLEFVDYIEEIVEDEDWDTNFVNAKADL